MKYPEFEHLKIIEDPQNPFCTLFEYEDGSRFYIEPAFYTQLMAFQEHYESEYPRILSKMEEIVRKNKKVVFTSNYESPQTNVEDYIYLEITDVTDPLKIYLDFKGDPDTGWKD